MPKLPTIGDLCSQLSLSLACGSMLGMATVSLCSASQIGARAVRCDTKEEPLTLSDKRFIGCPHLLLLCKMRVVGTLRAIASQSSYPQALLCKLVCCTFQTKRRSNPFGLDLHSTGNDLLSHRIVAALPSADEGLTGVFGMGTCVSPLL